MTQHLWWFVWLKAKLPFLSSYFISLDDTIFRQRQAMMMATMTEMKWHVHAYTILMRPRFPQFQCIISIYEWSREYILIVYNVIMMYKIQKVFCTAAINNFNWEIGIGEIVVVIYDSAFIPSIRILMYQKASQENIRAIEIDQTWIVIWKCVSLFDIRKF